MRLIVKSLPLPVEICLNILPLIVPSTLQRIFPSKCYVFNIKCIALRTPKMVTSCSFKWGYKLINSKHPNVNRWLAVGTIYEGENFIFLELMKHV